jgi:tetratricopeptide (TPR) repeat protein
VDDERKAQILTNLATMELQRGRAHAALRHADTGMPFARATGERDRTATLGARRISALLQLDRIAEARGEGEALLAAESAFRHPSRPFILRYDLALCALYQGAGRTALGELAALLQAPRCPPLVRVQVLGDWIDAVLDLDVLEMLGEFVPESESRGATALDLATRARLDALRSSSRGRQTEAATALEEALDQGRALQPRPAARFLAHLGRAHLEAGNRERAEHWIRGALDRLRPDECSYIRGRIGLQLARARTSAADPDGVLQVLDAVVTDARQFGFRGLLADALRMRAKLRVRGDGNPEHGEAA